ncbi:MAG TPA: class I SAM-dependent methyltransferase [Mycobacteriales bacterium]|nr:class I SAM-dependent methyltransferase [Mycobacteriales bacterium]
MSSISFDRAAGYYDATRTLPADRAHDLADLLAAELAGTDRALEIGVGTGRIALPLHQRGVGLIGVDLSAPMLRRLIDNAGGKPPFPVLVADATRLPFADASYDAVLASHVFHLIPAWQAAADEAMRVLRPGGRLLVDFGGGVDTPWRPLMLEIFGDHGIDRVRPGVSHPEKLASYYGGRTRMRRLSTLSMSTWRSPGKDLDDLEQQIFSWTWPYSRQQLRAAAEDARIRAAQTGLDLDAEVELTYRLQWWAFDRES